MWPFSRKARPVVLPAIVQQIHNAPLPDMLRLFGEMERAAEAKARERILIVPDSKFSIAVERIPDPLVWRAKIRFSLNGKQFSVDVQGDPIALRSDKNPDNTFGQAARGEVARKIGNAMLDSVSMTINTLFPVDNPDEDPDDMRF